MNPRATWLILFPIWLPGHLSGDAEFWYKLPRVTDSLVKMNEPCEWELSVRRLAVVPAAGQCLTCLVIWHHLLPVFSASHGLKSRAVAAYQGPVHCIATIVQMEGLTGLYRGASAMLLRDIPGYCFYFIPYVFLSEWITPEACTAPSPYAAWLAGGIAGKDPSHGSPVPGSWAFHSNGRV